VFDTAVGKELPPLLGSENLQFGSAVLSPNGEAVAALIVDGGDRILKVWRLAAAGEARVIGRWPATTVGPKPLFSHDGRLIMVALKGKETELVILRVEDGHKVRSLGGHSRGVACAAVTPDGKRLVTSDLDGQLRVWDTATWQELVRFREPTHVSERLHFSRDGKRLLSQGSDGIRIFDAAQAAARKSPLF
jgi:WD40 repeat protein